MKMTKRALCLLLAAVMALALTVPVLAMDEPDVPEAALADTPDVPEAASAEKIITLNAGKEGTLPDDVYSVTAVDDRLPVLPTPTREGWIFEGWYTGEVTETFDTTVMKPGQDGSNEQVANDNYYHWTITSSGKLAKEGDPAEGITALYAMYKPKTVTYWLHACGWKNKFGALKVSHEYGVPFDPYVIGWNATLTGDGNTAQYVTQWTSPSPYNETFNLETGWFTELESGTNITGGIEANGTPKKDGPFVGKDIKDGDHLYLHWQHSSIPGLNQTVPNGNNVPSGIRTYNVGRLASYVEFPKDQRTVVHIHEGGSIKLDAYPLPLESIPLDVQWECEPKGVVTIESLSGKDGGPLSAAAIITGGKISDKTDESTTKTATVTVTLTGKGGQKVTRSTTVIVGHNFNTYVSGWSGNCNKPGTIQWKCSIPGCTETYNQDTGVLHKYSNPITYPATCTTDGKTVQKCTVCGAELVTDEVEAKGHQFVKSEEPGCNGSMVTVNTCTVCGYTAVTGGTGHAFATTPTTDVEPTCISNGIQSRHCTNSDCHAVTDIEEISATGNHKWPTEWTEVIKATGENAGLKERFCQVCGARETEIIPQRPNYPIGGGGGGGAAPSPSPSTSPEPSPSESPSPEPSPEPGTTPTPVPVPVPVEPPKTENGSGWSYDYDTGDYYYFVDGTPKANYWAMEEAASQWGYWYYVGTDGKLATGLQYIENNNGTGWYFLQPDTDNGCVGRMLTGWQWIGPEAGTGWFNTAHGGVNGQCTYTTEWGDYNAADNTWGKDHIAH